MSYKTGDMAKIVGLTPQTLREYEKEGLLEAEKDPVAGYRYFNAGMVSKAIAIRSLRNMGFSLNKVKILLRNMDYNEYCAYFEDIKIQQEKALKKQILLCERAREQSETILHIHEALHQCVLLENVDIYCLDYMEGERPLLENKEEFEIMNAWTEVSMFTRNYSPVKAENFKNPVMGLAIEKKYADELELPVQEPVYLRHADRMLTMMARHSTHSLPEKKEIKILLDYANDQHLMLYGDPIIISRFSYWEDNEEISYSMLYYPVK